MKNLTDEIHVNDSSPNQPTLYIHQNQAPEKRSSDDNKAH